MTREKYQFRRAENENDRDTLEKFFNIVFHPEEVGTLARTFFDHLPGMKQEYWFIAGPAGSDKIASALALIPWTWQIEGITLKGAEMGIVGTGEPHRKQGLQDKLNSSFDRVLREENFDISFIQGIPGFYHNFGYNYALSFENHINLPLHGIGTMTPSHRWRVRDAVEQDIPFLMKEDKIFSTSFSITSLRREKDWKYIFSHSRKTEYGGEFRIIEDLEANELFYFKISPHGFGEGLIISEISEGISAGAFAFLCSFCKEAALERNKPWLRFDLSEDSRGGRLALAAGAVTEGRYGWQVRIPDPAAFLRKISPLLEQRLGASPYKTYSGTLLLDFYRSHLFLKFNEGRITGIDSDGSEPDLTFGINEDLFAPLCLGYRSWEELQHCRPDIRPLTWQAGDLINALFPKKPSWIHSRY